MKKFVGMILAVLMLVALLPLTTLPVSAESEPESIKGTCSTGGGVHWELKGDTMRLSGNGNIDNYGYYNQTPWYQYGANNDVKHLEIGTGEDDNITRIGSWAFAYFNNLEDIKLGEGLQVIEYCAFYCATSKNKAVNVDLVIPSTVYYIGDYAFGYAYGLRNVNIKSDFSVLPSYVRGTPYYFVEHKDPICADRIFIQYCAFYYCDGMTTLSIGNFKKNESKNVQIGEYAFGKCYKLETIYLSDTFASADYGAFYGCSKLKNVYYYGLSDNFPKDSISSGRNDYFIYAINNKEDRHIVCNDTGTYTYIDKNGNAATLDGTKEYCRIMTSDTTDLKGGWYVVNSDVNFGKTRIRVSGDVNILLLDGCSITTSGGIGIPYNTEQTLNIYSQSLGDNMGSISVDGAPSYCAGIGTDGVLEWTAPKNCGHVNIYGGRISSRGADWSAGIGGGEASKCSVTITNGDITAYGGDRAAGIGTGAGQLDYSDVYISGGTVCAYGGTEGAGIGTGVGSLCNVYISGGNITAIGYDYGSGIGSSFTSGCNIVLSGDCIINAKGGKDAVDIGNGNSSHGGTVTDTRNSGGSTLSEGNLWIIAVCAVVIVGAVVAFVICKKKKRPVLANSEEK